MNNYLLLIVTHNCNLRCNYCDVIKKDVSMTKNVAEKAIFFAFELAKRKKEKKILIRFFGGEPLLKWQLVKYVVGDAVRKSLKDKIKVKFNLTTNGLLLDINKIEFFKRHPEIELIVSLDGNLKSQNLNRNFNGKIDSYANIIKFKSRLVNLKNVTINMVVAPNQVNEFYNNFMHIYKLGFKRFNFLPAYFIYWPKEGLNALVKEFGKILAFIREKEDCYVKNIETLSDIPFFNHGIVVNCGGDVYRSNIFLSKYLEVKKNDFKVGTINKENALFESLKFSDGTSILNSIKDNAGGKLFYSTMKVDAILSNFVKKLKIKSNGLHKKN